jgi:hypothetical protein
MWRGGFRFEHICSRLFRLAMPHWFDHGSVSTSTGTGGGRPPPVPTDRGVRISRTTLFGSWFTAFTAICSRQKAVTPVAWSPCRPRTIQLPLTASPCSRLSRPQSTISQSGFHPVIRPFSPLRLGRSYGLAPEPDGSPLFALLPLVACWRYDPGSISGRSL